MISQITASPQSRSEIKIIRVESRNTIKEAIKNRKITQKNLWTIFALLNSFQYIAAKKYGAAEAVEGKIVVKRDRLDALVAASQSGLLELTVSTDWLQEHLSRHWKQWVNTGLKTIRKCRQVIADWGLYDFTPGVKSVTVTPLAYRRVDFLKMLLFSEVIESILLEMDEENYKAHRVSFDENNLPVHHDNLELLPKHRAMSTVLLFNAVFGEVAQYRRLDDFSDRPLDLPSEPADIPPPKKFWRWTPKFKLPFSSWKTMICQRIVERDIQLESVWQACVGAFVLEMEGVVGAIA